MAETSESSTRRWSGYVCPDCRFVFRVPRDHDGSGLVCPSCRRLLRLPAPGEVLPPLVAPAHEMPAEVEAHAAHASSHGSHRGRSGRRRRDNPAWEEDGRKRSSNSDRLVIGGVAVAMLALTAGALLLLQSKPRPVASAPAPAAYQLVEPEPVRPPVVAEDDPKALMEMAEPMAKAFLTARNVADILPLIRHPEISGPRLKQKWPGDKVVPQGFSSFAEDGGIAIDGDVMGATVVAGDYSSRLMYFAKTDKGWKIDWESWVDWPVMSWADFLAKKPAKPVPFRVVITDTSYYNFGFSDDKKWRSVRLESVDGQQNLYGYLERDSETDRALNLEGRPKGLQRILELAFPEGGQSNQVVIGKVVSTSWVLPESKDQP